MGYRHSGIKYRRAVAVLLSLIMTVMLSAQAVQAVAAPVKKRPVPEMSQIREMLEGRDYVEGDAIVVAERGFDPARFIRGDSEKLAEANDESLALTAEAAKETDDAAQGVAAERADASGASSYNISKVHSDTMDTAELIAKLYTSPKVISAEPNYVFNAAEAYAVEDNEAPADPDDPAGKESADGQTGNNDTDGQAVNNDTDGQAVNDDADGQAVNDDADGQAADKTDGADAAGTGAGTDGTEETVAPAIGGGTDARNGEAGKDNKDTAGTAPAGDEKNLRLKNTSGSGGQHDPEVGDLSSAQWYLGEGGGCNTLEGDGINVGMDVPGYAGHGTGEENSSPASTIAILDSGMDVSHPDLQGQFYEFTPAQQAKYHCGKYGLNATADPDDPDVGDLTDYVDHGTHCSGIMSAKWDGKGVAGVANGARLVGVRLSEDTGSQTLEGNLRGFNFLINCASEINLKSVNCSWGADTGAIEFTYTLLVNELGRHGVVTVFAAGNSLNDTDQKIETPSFIDSPYLLTVDAMNPAGNRSCFSNYGETQTDVFAPGSDIMSTVPATVTSKGPGGESITEIYRRYHPESGQGVMQRVRFSEQDVLVEVYEHDPIKNPSEKHVGYYKAETGTDDDASMRIPRDYFKDPGVDSTEVKWMPGDSVFLRVKVGDNIDPGDIKFITTRVATEFGLSSVIGSLYGVAVQDNNDLSKKRMATLGNDTEGKMISAQARGSKSAWGTATLDVDDVLSGNEHVYVDNDGCIFLWLGVQEQRADDLKTESIFVDDITIGRRDGQSADDKAHASAHIVFNGTSMAAPTVTAALGIIARDEQPNSKFKAGEGEGTLGMQALKRSARLRAATQHADHLEDCCATGGFVRLSSYGTGSTEDKPLAPIIASCAQTDNKSKKIEVNGWFFGESKSDTEITVDGKKAAIESWSKDKIIIALPESVGNGAHVLRIQTSAGIDKAPLSTSYDDPSVKTSLYEYDLSVPDPFAADPEGNDSKFFPGMVATGDCIYTLQKDLVSKVSAVWRYRIASDKWEMIGMPTRARMTVDAGTVMAPTPNGFVLLASEQTGTNEYGTPIMEPHLYYYDAGSGRWTRKPLPEGIQPGMSIFTRGGDLYFAGIGREITVDGETRLSVLEVLREGGSKIECLGTVSTGEYYSAFLSNCKVADCGGYIYLLGQEPIGGSYPLSYALSRFKLDENDEVENITVFFDELAEAGIIEEGVWDSTVALASIGCGVAVINREKEGTDTMLLENGSDKFEEYERTSSFYHGNSQMAVSYGEYLYVFGYSPSEPGKMFFRATRLFIDHLWDDGKVTRKPTPEMPGEMTYTCRRCGFVHTMEIPYGGSEYACIYGDGSEWLRGSSDPLVFRFERLHEDEAYERYERILIDGKELSGENFDIEKGSLVVKLKAPYLETLSDGKHRITAEFNDGSADAAFAVVSGGSHKVKTGDDGKLVSWLILLIVSASVLGALTRRRSRA